MPDTFEVVGDDLLVTHGTSTERLSLAVPMDRVQIWIDRVDGGVPAENHSIVRDQVMPDAAAAYVREVEQIDGVRAFAIVARWSNALRESLGKALLLPGYTESTEPPSPPTSGNDSGSDSPTPSRRRRSKPSPAAS